MLSLRIRSLLLNIGYFVSKTSNDGEVRKVLHSLKPYATDKQLIRIGGETDGGYLIPDDLDGIEYCFSPGVAGTAGFESDLASKGIRSFLADYSVDGPPVESTMLHFDKKDLGSVNNATVMTLEHWIAQLSPTYAGDLILQMDIEGSEYGVILETPETIWKRFRIVVIEFHGLHTMFNEYGLKLFTFCLQKLLSIFEVVHVHPNNASGSVKKRNVEIPSVVEVTLLRRDRVRWRKEALVFPHPLDRPNCPAKRDLALPECWYR